MKRSEIHPELLEKLNDAEQRYKKATALATRLPLFASRIITNEFTGNDYCTLSDRYKALPLSWGICWNPHSELTNRKQPLKPEERGVVQVYINCYSLFPDECYAAAQGSLAELITSIKVFYFDFMNTNFYFKPEEVEAGLEALNDWYVTMRGRVSEIQQAKRKTELLAELAKLENKE
jgi:hypothetical protein